MAVKALDALGGIAAATLAVAAGALLLGAGGPAQVEPAEIELLEAVAPAIARSCKACGWIESRREDQYTVRMRDGSSRVFEEIPGVKWRLGERLIYID
jgi:hypothetical protein